MVRVVPLLLACALGVAGCSGGGDDSPEPTASAVDPQNVSPEDLPEIPDLKGGKGAIADATFGDCAVKPGKAEVDTTVRNSTDSTADYVVAISWINKRSDVLARGVKKIEGLEVDGSTEITVKATVPEGVDSCTYFVTRASA